MDGTEEEATLFDKIQGHVVEFVWAALRRHWRVALIAGGLPLVLGLIVIMSLPREYEVTMRVLTNRSYIIPNLVQRRRSIPIQADNPTRGAIEIINSRAFLTDLMENTNLLKMFKGGPGGIGGLIDRIKPGKKGDASKVEEEGSVRKTMLRLLARRIDTRIRDEGIIQMTVAWDTPELALVLAEEVLSQFLKNKQENELSQIRDTQGILEASIRSSRILLNESADRLEQLLKAKEGEVAKRIGAKPGAGSRVMSFRRPSARPESAELDEKQSLLQRMSRDYQRELSRAKDDLQRRSETLGPAHPDLASARRRVKELQNPPPELIQLNVEVSRLLSELEVKGRRTEGGGGAAPAGGSSRFDVVQVPMTEEVFAALSNDPEVESMMTELRTNVENHNELLDRLSVAEIEVEASKAAFAYKYTVTQPPVLPEYPVRPKRKLLAVGLLGLCFFIFAAVVIGLDAFCGRILQPWQVERILGTRLLGTIDSKSS